MELKTFPLGKYEDEYGQQWSASVELNGTEEPVVLLKRAGSNISYPYNLHQFFSIAPCCSGFHVAGGELSDPVFTIPAGEAMRIASQAMGHVSPKRGRYEIRWIPDDPRVPF